MKIGFIGLDIVEGKTKYNDEKLNKLAEKFSPQKITPYFAEFIAGDLPKADALAVAKDQLLDLLIMDMEKLEGRAANSSDEKEKGLLQRCLKELEAEVPLCDQKFDAEETKIMNVLAPLSFKPTLIVDNFDGDASCLIGEVLKKAEMTFFYTAGKKEVHAWLIKKGLSAVGCAEKIHSDLARGFIKAEVVSFDDFMSVHNMHEARDRGLVKLVDRDYPINESDVIEIRFNV